MILYMILLLPNLGKLFLGHDHLIAAGCSFCFLGFIAHLCEQIHTNKQTSPRPNLSVTKPLYFLVEINGR